MNQTPNLAPEIASALNALKTRIRAYVWLEGLALCVAWLGLTFWLGLALDYLPVLVWAHELPWIARAAMLAGIALVLVFIVYRYILRRSFVAFANRSMALLLERNHRRFNDSLVTSVEMSDFPDHAHEFNPEMLAETRQLAADEVRSTRLSEVFDFKPLMLSGLAAAFFLAITGLFFAANSEAFGIWVNRLYLLGNQPWPREANISGVGIEIKKSTALTGVESEVIPFGDDRILKVPSGAEVVIHVQADTKKPPTDPAKPSTAEDRVVPEACVIYTITHKQAKQEEEKSWLSNAFSAMGIGDAEVEMDRKTMQKIGREKVIDGKSVQLYRYDGKPFNGMNTADIDYVEFFVQGHDHRIETHKLLIVPTPIINGKETKIHAKLPKYLEGAVTSLNPVYPYGPKLQIPIGAEVHVETAANKPLESVKVYWPEKEKEIPAIVFGENSDQFKFDLGTIAGNVSLEVTLKDQDGLQSEKPQRMEILAKQDLPPDVRMAMDGIGTAVTPNVRIPVKGKILDDFAAKSAWFKVLVDDDIEREYEIKLDGTEDVKDEIDFQKLALIQRNEDDAEETPETSEAPEASESPEETEPTPDEAEPVAAEELVSRADLKLVAGQKLALSIQAKDGYDLGEDPNIGAGDVYELEVVTPDELLQILERREVSLRRDLEKAIGEVEDLRNELVAQGLGASSNVYSAPEDEAGLEPGDTIREPGEADPAEEPAVGEEGEELTDENLRDYAVQRAMNQSLTSTHTVSQLAENFQQIRQQLINNRVDSEDRKERLQKQVYLPLQDTANLSFPKLDEKLLAVKEKLDANADYASTGQIAVDQADEIIVELRQVLDKLMKYETFNELLDIIRDLKGEQEELMEITRKKQREEALKGALEGALD